MIDQLRQLLDYPAPLSIIADTAEEAGAPERYVTWMRSVAGRPGQRELCRGRVYAAVNDRAEEMAVFVCNQLHSWACMTLGIDGYDSPSEPE